MPRHSLEGRREIPGRRADRSRARPDGGIGHSQGGLLARSSIAFTGIVRHVVQEDAVPRMTAQTSIVTSFLSCRSLLRRQNRLREVLGSSVARFPRGDRYLTTPPGLGHCDGDCTLINTRSSTGRSMAGTARFTRPRGTAPASFPATVYLPTGRAPHIEPTLAVMGRPLDWSPASARRSDGLRNVVRSSFGSILSVATTR